MREGKLVALHCSIDRLVLEMLNEYYLRMGTSSDISGSCNLISTDPDIVDVFLLTHRYYVQAPALLAKFQVSFLVSVHPTS